MQAPITRRSGGTVFHTGVVPGGASSEPPIVHQRMNTAADIARFVNEPRGDDDGEDGHPSRLFQAQPRETSHVSVSSWNSEDAGQQRASPPPQPVARGLPQPQPKPTRARANAGKQSESDSGTGDDAAGPGGSSPPPESLVKSGTGIFSPGSANITINPHDVSSIPRAQTAGAAARSPVSPLADDIVASPRRGSTVGGGGGGGANPPPTPGSRRESQVTFADPNTMKQQQVVATATQPASASASPAQQQQQLQQGNSYNRSNGGGGEEPCVTLTRRELDLILHEREAFRHEAACLNQRCGEMARSFEQCRAELQQARSYIQVMKQKIAAAVAPEALCRTQQQIWDQRHGVDDTDVKLRAIYDELSYVKKQTQAFTSGPATSSDPYVSMRHKYEAEIRRLTEQCNRDAAITAAMRDDMDKVVQLYFYGLKQLAQSVTAAAEGAHYPPPLGQELQQLLSDPRAMALAEAAAQPGFFEQHLPRHKLSSKTQHHLLERPAPLGCGPKSITAFIQDVKETIHRCFVVVSDNVIAVGQEASAMRGVLQETAAAVVDEVRSMMVPQSLFTPDFLAQMQATAERAVSEVEAVMFPDGVQGVLPRLQSRLSRRDSIGAASSRHSATSRHSKSHHHHHSGQQRDDSRRGSFVSAASSPSGSPHRQQQQQQLQQFGRQSGISPIRGGGGGGGSGIGGLHSQSVSGNGTPNSPSLNLDVSANTPMMQSHHHGLPPQHPSPVLGAATAPPGASPGIVLTPQSLGGAAAAAAAAAAAGGSDGGGELLLRELQQQVQQLQAALQQAERDKERMRDQLVRDASKRLMGSGGGAESLMHVTSTMSNMCCLLSNNLKMAEENRTLTETILAKFYAQIRSMIRVPKRMEEEVSATTSSSSMTSAHSEEGTQVG